MRATKISSVILAVSAILLIAVSGAPFSNVRSDQDLVKLRNALHYETTDPAVVFQWGPESMPADFLREEQPAPPLFHQVLSQLPGDLGASEFERAVQMAIHLVKAPNRSGQAIQSSIARTYEEIVEEGEGYCADYTLVLNGLALSDDIPIREWGMSFDGFGGDGHAFSEIYDRALEKWIFLDSFYSFYVRGPSGEPLSVMEFRRYLLNGDIDSLDVVPIKADRFMFPSFEYALNYYRRGANFFFMVWGNNVFTYEDHPAVRILSRISRSAEQAAGILFGVQPRIMILRTPENQDAIDELSKLRIYLRIAIVCAVVAVASALVLLATWICVRRRDTRAAR